MKAVASTPSVANMVVANMVAVNVVVTNKVVTNVVVTNMVVTNKVVTNMVVTKYSSSNKTANMNISTSSRSTSSVAIDCHTLNWHKVLRLNLKARDRAASCCCNVFKYKPLLIEKIGLDAKDSLFGNLPRHGTDQ